MPSTKTDPRRLLLICPATWDFCPALEQFRAWKPTRHPTSLPSLGLIRPTQLFHTIKRSAAPCTDSSSNTAHCRPVPFASAALDILLQDKVLSRKLLLLATFAFDACHQKPSSTLPRTFNATQVGITRPSSSPSTLHRLRLLHSIADLYKIGYNSILVHTPQTASSAIPRDPGLSPHSIIPTYGLIAWLFISKNPYAPLLVLCCDVLCCPFLLLPSPALPLKHRLDIKQSCPLAAES